MNAFLTREEVTELTGSSTKAGQIEILNRNNIQHSINKVGWPMVTWYQVNHPIDPYSMGGSSIFNVPVIGDLNDD